MPKVSDLPASLRSICEQQALEVRNAQFDSDIARLVRAIEWHRNNRAIRTPEELAPPLIEKPAPISPSRSSDPPKPNKPATHATTPVATSKSAATNRTSKPATAGVAEGARQSAKRRPSATDADLRKLGGLYYMAEAGDSQYLYEIGTRLEKGHRIPRDLDLALKYYERAANAGYGRALFSIDRVKAKLKDETPDPQGSFAKQQKSP